MRPPGRLRRIKNRQPALPPPQADVKRGFPPLVQTNAFNDGMRAMLRHGRAGRGGNAAFRKDDDVARIFGKAVQTIARRSGHLLQQGRLCPFV